MNNKVKFLVFSILSFIINQKTASTYTNKTVIGSSQQALSDVHWITTAIRGSGPFNLKEKQGAISSFLWFYGKNVNNTPTGQYFGFNNKNIITLGTDIPANKIIAGSTSTATIKLSPKVLDYGVTIAWYQSLWRIYKELNTMIILPIAHKEQTMGLSTKDPDFANYFKGGAIEGQDALKNARIIGKHSTTNLTGLYIDLADSRYWLKKIIKARLKVALVVPTGKYGKVPITFGAGVKATAWVVGTGLSTESILWGQKNHSIRALVSFAYYYKTGVKSNRTLGLKNVNWGQYQLITVPGQVKPAPAANFLTTDVKSDPNWNFGLCLGLTYNKNAFSTNAGYNIYYAAQESINIKTPVIAPTLIGAQLPSVVDKKAAQLQAQLTHTIYGIAGYSFKDWDSPVSINLGGQYIIAAKNSAVNFLQVWIKGGILF